MVAIFALTASTDLKIVDGARHRPGATCPAPLRHLPRRATCAPRHLPHHATCPTGIISTAAYDVNVPFMQLEQHGWDIHAV